MKVLSLQAPGRLVVKEEAVPTLKRGEILVKMKCSGVCGTDLEKVRGDAITPPVLGHEVAGEVARLGEGVTGFRAGDRVFAHHHAACGSCSRCRRGDYTLCEEFPRHNIRPGGFAEYFAVPEWNVSRGAVLKLPDSMSFEEASFVEPLGCCLRGFAKARGADADSAFIYGAGPVGLTFLKLLKGAGRKVVVSDFSPYRVEFARKLGADYAFDPRGPHEDVAAGYFDGEGPELAVLATGDPAAFRDALANVRPGGRVLLFGAPRKGAEAQMGLDGFFLRSVTVSSSYSTSEVETAEALRLLSSGKMTLGDLVTHRFPLAEGPDAFRTAQEQRCIKAVVLD